MSPECRQERLHGAFGTETVPMIFDNRQLAVLILLAALLTTALIASRGSSWVAGGCWPRSQRVGPVKWTRRRSARIASEVAGVRRSAGGDRWPPGGAAHRGDHGRRGGLGRRRRPAGVGRLAGRPRPEGGDADPAGVPPPGARTGSGGAGGPGRAGRPLGGQPGPAGSVDGGLRRDRGADGDRAGDRVVLVGRRPSGAGSRSRRGSAAPGRSDPSGEG